MTQADFTQISEREQGLKRRLTANQMSMIAIGGAIGTGLFLGSKFAISFAGPSVILSYAIGGFITLLLMACLAEMTVAHSTSGSFGAYAEHYISPLAGFLVRYSYWSCVVLAVGTEITAVAEYMQYWFKGSPAWMWVLIFSSVLVFVNAVSVKTFGTIEYWFSTIKITAIVTFIILGIYVVWANPEYGSVHYYQHGGFFPNGLWGMWVAVVISIFSYISIEMIAVAAGEAENPEQAVKQAFKATIARLVIFYLLTLALIMAIIPWTEVSNAGSPFVLVMSEVNIPFAAGVINFVLLIAALSAMNSQLYVTTRIMFSLSRAGHAPKTFSKISSNGVPLYALFISTSGIALAVGLSIFYPQSAFIFMMSIAMFGALFTWMMIFVTHYFFRRQRIKQNLPKLSFHMLGFPYLTLLGAGLVLAILLTTIFTTSFKMTLVFGIPFLLVLVLWYKLFFAGKS